MVKALLEVHSIDFLFPELPIFVLEAPFSGFRITRDASINFDLEDANPSSHFVLIGTDPNIHSNQGIVSAIKVGADYFRGGIRGGGAIPC
jgi:hypothetical protein